MRTQYRFSRYWEAGAEFVSADNLRDALSAHATQLRPADGWRLEVDYGAGYRPLPWCVSNGRVLSYVEYMGGAEGLQ